MPPGELERIGELLVEEGGVTQEDLTRGLTEGGLKSSPLGQLLDTSGHVRRAELAAFLASRFRIPVLDDLRKIDISADAARLVPEDIARKHEAIPVARFGDILCVAKSNYYNRAAVQELRKVSGLKIKVIQADEGQVRAAMEAVYRGKKGDLPPPGKRKDTGIRSSTSRIQLATPPRGAETADVPLIQMPENGANKPILTEVRGNEDLNEVIEVLDAIKVTPLEFSNAARDPLARLVLDFEEVFQIGRPVAPQRV
jgi:hypothetical protein